MVARFGLEILSKEGEAVTMDESARITLAFKDSSRREFRNNLGSL